MRRYCKNGQADHVTECEAEENHINAYGYCSLSSSPCISGSLLRQNPALHHDAYECYV